MASYCRKIEIKYDLQRVLSSKKFLTKELRQIPRVDTRKEAIKKDIQNALLLSKTYNDFESYLKDKKYQIIKGRGIAFNDKMRVYVKGCEVGYSLCTNEKILQRSPEHKQIIISMQREKDSTYNKHSQQRSLYREQNMSNEMKKDLDKLVDILLKPEYNNNYRPHQLLEKKRTKKKKNLSI